MNSCARATDYRLIQRFVRAPSIVSAAWRAADSTLAAPSHAANILAAV